METYKIDDVKRYENFFTKNDFSEIVKFVLQPNWYFGHGSYVAGDKRRGYPFWRMDLMENNFFSKYLLNIIEEKTQQNYELFDVYANGHTFGTKGSFHQDWNDRRGITFLYYANENWDLDWGGKTIFDLGLRNYHFVVPKPNSAVLFPGVIPHAAEGPSRSFTGLRVTVAWKLLLR